MSFNARPRKRISFTPIMLTSKSIRPVDRSDYESTRNQRRFSGVKKSSEDLPQYILRNSSQFANATTCGFEYARDCVETQGNNTNQESQESYKKWMRKVTTANVVQVEFQEEMVKARKKADSKLREIPEGEGENSNEKGKFIYFSNAKTFEQFTKMAKIRPKKNPSLIKDQVDEEWSKYLDKYYLNIRKVKPLLRKQFQYDENSPEEIARMSEMQQKVKTKDHESSQLMKSKGNTHIRTHSKRQSRLSRRQASPTARGNSQEGAESACNSFIYKKIEQDINVQRSNTHRKDFFVFGMSEAVGKTPEATVKTKFDIYRDFIFRVNFTNGLYVRNREENEKQLKFYVGFGNNSALIKGIMRRRFWWQLVDKVTDDTNFIWTQLKIADVFKKQSRSITKIRTGRYSRIDNLSKEGSSTAIEKSNESQDCNRNLMCGEDLLLWEKYIEKNGKYQEKGYDQCLVKRVGGLLKKKGICYIDNNSKLKVHNHLQSNYFLGNKKALFYSMRKYYELMKEDPYTKIPITFHITHGIQDPQFQHFLQQFQRQNEKRKGDKEFRNIWIIKPGEFTNRGRGITVCSTLDQIKNRLKSKQRNANGTNRTFIVQKYIQKPLLYQRRKFDIRHYMAVTCLNGKMKGYWYADGYIRTTSSQYNIKNTKDLFTHLTNDAVQKYGQDYGKYEKGNKISYQEFQKYLNSNVSAEIDFQSQILAKMKELATESIRATYSVLDPERRQHNFQLFGLDFMLDQSLNVYLIEVNTNPCLETSCPLLTKIITPLVENLFKLCLDPLYPPPFEWPTQKKFNLGQNALQQNKFCLVFDQAQQGLQLKQLYKHTSRIDLKMGDIFQQDEQYNDEQKQWNDEQEVPKKGQ